MPDDKPLAGRLALITGASRGIGRAVALAYAKAGAHVILMARTVGALEELDDEIRALGGTATLLPLDISKVEKLDALGPTILQRWDKLDIFVANAGVLGPLSPLGHITTESWREVIDINLTANWHLIRALEPLLKRSDAGRAKAYPGENPATLKTPDDIAPLFVKLASTGWTETGQIHDFKTSEVR